MTCFANTVVGLSSITSFTYYLILDSAYASIPASAIIVDSTGGNRRAVASVNITDRLPTIEDTVQAVTATFASPVALDPQHTYQLAFCSYQTGATRVMYALQGSVEVNAALICFQDPAACTSASGEWYGVSAILQTIISGGCASSQSPSSSPSPSSSLSPSPSPSPSASPSASPSPARGGADRLTPGKAFGAPAVRFLFGLGAFLQ
jgi:hypothetical protein